MAGRKLGSTIDNALHGEKNGPQTIKLRKLVLLSE